MEKSNACNHNPNETLCIHCDRTGCNEHLKASNYRLLPKSLLPCSWVRDGTIPNGAEYVVRDVITGGGISITKCPLFIDKFSEESKKHQTCFSSMLYDCERKKRPTKRVRCIDTGEIFDSAEAVTQRYNRSMSHIRKCVYEGTPSMDGLRFEYVGEERI